jgi:hypothetical protein
VPLVWGTGLGITDLSEEPGCADSAGLGERGEDLGVGMGCELGCDLVLEGLDLGAQAAQPGDQSESDLGPGGALGPSGSAWCVVQVSPEQIEVGLVVVADRPQPLPQPDPR